VKRFKKGRNNVVLGELVEVNLLYFYVKRFIDTE